MSDKRIGESKRTLETRKRVFGRPNPDIMLVGPWTLRLLKRLVAQTKKRGRR